MILFALHYEYFRNAYLLNVSSTIVAMMTNYDEYCAKHCYVIPSEYVVSNECSPS